MMLLLDRFLLPVLFSVVQLCQCDEDIQFSEKVVSDTKGDEFGASVATSHRHVVIGAPNGKGYVQVEPGSNKIHGLEGRWFGQCVDMNQHFIVVGGGSPSSPAVFSSNRPFNLMARIPIGCGSPECVEDVKINDDSTIIIAYYDPHNHGVVSVYGYDGQGAWSREHQMAFNASSRIGSNIKIAASGSNIAVALNHYLEDCIHIYTRVNKTYIHTATLYPPEPVDAFGQSVAMEGLQLIVDSTSREGNVIFTYQYDPSTSIWMKQGRLVVPTTGYAFSSVSLHQGILAVAVNDRIQHPEVCAYVYKLVSNKSNNNSDDVSNSTNATSLWKKVANLRTNREPTKGRQYHSAISVQNCTVFTGRKSYEGYGMVFVHNV